jgi:hypothetical protein
VLAVTDENADLFSGRSKGGIARAEALTPEKRRAIAKKAASARWGVKATHKGSFKEDFGLDVECYVLDDDSKTAVISQRGMGEAIGLGKSGGSRLPDFIEGKKIAPYVGRELREKLENPLIFQAPSLGASQPPTPVHGYDVTILIDICKAIIKAADDGSLLKRQEHIAKQAHVIVNASAKLGIQHLVYKLSGYDQTREEVVAAFKLYVREEAREYEKEFPDQLYAEWYRLYDLPKPQKNKPWKFKYLTIQHVYEPVAQSHGKVYLLTQAVRAGSGQRWKKLHQFLSEIGVKALRTQLGQTLGIAQVSDTREAYEANMERVFGRQKDLFRN